MSVDNPNECPACRGEGFEVTMRTPRWGQKLYPGKPKSRRHYVGGSMRGRQPAGPAALRNRSWRNTETPAHPGYIGGLGLSTGPASGKV
jgi:hypothetical protein